MRFCINYIDSFDRGFDIGVLWKLPHIPADLRCCRHESIGDQPTDAAFLVLA